MREQLHRLEGRLRERRERHREGGMGESDKGGGGCFEEDLERLLEKHLVQRNLEESALISHYNSQLQSCPDPLQSLQHSLASLRSLHSHNKREAIKALKQRYQLL